jgi:hypothetical protein
LRPGSYVVIAGTDTRNPTAIRDAWGAGAPVPDIFYDVNPESGNAQIHFAAQNQKAGLLP